MNMDDKDKCEVLKSNPVTAVQSRLFFKLILQGPARPLGKMKDYFYRVEFQAQGAPHIHCLFLIEDAPRFGTLSNEQVISFMDRYVSGTLPNECDDPELSL